MPTIDKYYRVAGLVFSISMPEEVAATTDLSQYSPFAVDGGNVAGSAALAAGRLFALDVHHGLPPRGRFSKLLTEPNGDASITAGTLDGRNAFVFSLQDKPVAWMLAFEDERRVDVYVVDSFLYAINNAAMISYAMFSATRHTLLVHASVVSHGGRAYLFLGKSGTGKSTHSRLWMENIAATELVNDDNPVVSTADGTARVFGSPWSGKTPCYRNLAYPIGAFVQLSQAPHNAIRRQSPIESYASLTSSVSAMRWHKQLADGVHRTQDELIGSVSFYHLECLPDGEAAMLCHQTVTKS